MIYDAIVVGGGIVGASIAYHLVQQGQRTLLFDAALPGRATEAAAGLLLADMNPHASEQWLELATAATVYYPSLIGRLRAEKAGDTGFAICGQLAVAVTDAEVEQWDGVFRWLSARQQKCGLPRPEDLHELTADQARALCPPLGHVRRALYHSRAARLDGRLLTQALLRVATARGLNTRYAAVDRLALESGVVRGVIAGAETHLADRIAIAAGAWSGRFAEPLGISIPVKPVKGQIIHLSLAGTQTESWPQVVSLCGYYMVPWPNGRIAVGATQEPDVGFSAQPTASGVHELLREGLRLLPGIAHAELLEARAGLRPCFAEQGMPAIGRALPEHRNVYLAVGHGPHGLHLGPYSGKLVADLMVEN